jgi:uncharacterized membrane protein
MSATPAKNSPSSARGQSILIGFNRLVYAFGKQWFLIFFLLSAMYVGLPFAAPLFMRLGWTSAANLIYGVYSLLCHQLPQRSFFLFGEEWMISLDQIKEIWQNTNNPLLLRKFIGNPEWGFKVAWSDRMVSMYTSIPLVALFWRAFYKRIRPLSILGFVLFLLPMALDGGTHFLSDFAGIGEGFRYRNEWLAVLTGNSLSTDFYRGDSWGSFNSWMRLISGVLFAIGVVWMAFPYLQEAFEDLVRQIETKFGQAGETL